MRLPRTELVHDDTEDVDTEVRVFTREQLAAFLAIVHPTHRLMFRLLASTGLRVSELIALQWRHLALAGSQPHVKVRRGIVRGRVQPPKSKHGRRDVPLGPALVSELREHREATDWPGDEDPVFASQKGTPLQPGNLRRRVLKPVAEEVDAPWAGFHTFRHTTASLLFADGRNVKQVQRWLGHHSPSFTLAVYVHLLGDDVAEPIDLAVELAGAGTVESGIKVAARPDKNALGPEPLAGGASLVRMRESQPLSEAG